MVSSSLLFGVALTGTNIARANRTAISNELGTPTFEIIQKEDGEKVDNVYYKSKYTKLGGQDGLIQAGKNMCKEIEEEGAVLLENRNNALPLKEGTKVSLFGTASFRISVGGRGSSHTRNPQPATSLKEALENAGLQVNNVLNDFYDEKYNTVDGKNKPYQPSGWTHHTNDVPFSEIQANKEAYDSIKEYGDVAIFTVTRMGGESNDLPTKGSEGIDGDFLNLTEKEASVLQGLGQLKKNGVIKKIVVLLNTTNQIQTSSLNKPEYGIDATMWIGHVGITGTEAIGEILTGKKSPSGHLSDTFWYKHTDNPVLQNQGVFTYANRGDFPELPEASKGRGGNSDKYGTYVAYQEGVYLGYRYSETRYTDVITKRENAGEFDYNKVISAPFGFGLSYTDFSFSDFNVERNGKDFVVTVKVTNTGTEYHGKDVAQIYLQKPYSNFDIERGIEKPAVELVGYAKTDELAPNASQTLTIPVSGECLRVYDRKVSQTYIVTEGKYLFTAAHDAHDAANNFLAHEGYSKKDGMTSDGNKNLVKSFNQKFDEETYSHSRGTGHKIHNLFDHSDINSYEGNTLDFLSRSNWTKPLAKDLKLTKEMVDLILKQEDSSSIQKDDGKYPTYGAENNLQLIDLLMDEDKNPISYDDQLWDKFLDQLTWEETVKLVSLGLRCSAGLDRLGKPQTKDHNGPTGLTQKYNEDKRGLAATTNDPDGDKAPVYYPSIPVLAATFNKDVAKRFGECLGEDALWAGYNGFYGIGLNSHRSPYEGRHFEYFSEDPFLAGTLATEEVLSLQAKGCNAYIKHFALNDQESQRSGIQVWSNEQALREISLRPYEYAVIDGHAVHAMASFSRIGLELCPASHALLTDYLRGELGMTGFVVTDMYSIGYKEEQMPAFLMAGCDLPDGELGTKVANPFNDFKSGYSNVAWQMREACKRTMYSTLHSNAMNGIDSNTIMRAITPTWEVAAITGTSILGVIFGGFTIWCAVAIFLDYRRKHI